MSRKMRAEENEEMLPEYDFAHGVRGKHHAAYAAGTNVVFLELDVARIFPDSASGNRVLQLLVELAKENVAPKRPV